MRPHAITCKRRGGPESLVYQQVDLNEPRTNELRIRVHRAGVLLGDVFFQKGLIPGSPKPPFVPGFDAIGTVESVGPGTSIRVGSLVGCLVGFGGYASHLILPEHQAVELPSKIDLDVASSLIMPYLTAHQILHRTCAVQPGQKLLVHGGGGATGSALIDLATRNGLQVWTTASTRHRGWVQSLGACAIDPHHEDFVAVLADEGGMDAIVDPIGGRHFERSYATLAPGGTLVATAAMSALRGAGTLEVIAGFAKLMLKNLWPDGRKAGAFNVAVANAANPSWLRSDIAKLVAGLDEHPLRTRPTRSFSLEDAPAAQTALLSSLTTGRVVLTPV